MKDDYHSTMPTAADYASKRSYADTEPVADKGDLAVINDQIMHTNSCLYELFGQLTRINAGLFGPTPERALEGAKDGAPPGAIPNIHLNIKLQKEILEQVFGQISRLQRL